MSAVDLKRQRLAEMEQKKQKLAEMRLQRMQHERERSNQTLTNGVELTRKTMTTQELDSILMDAGINVPPSTKTIEDTGNQSNAASGDNLSIENSSILASHKIFSNNNNKRPCNLELSIVNSISIPPKSDAICYTKTTQTDDERIYAGGEFSMGSQELAFDDEMSLDENQIIAPTSGFDESPTREIRKHLHALQFRQQTIQLDSLEGPTGLVGNAGNAPTKLPDLSEEEKRQILNSREFNRFFQHTARVIERALAEDVDIFMDYINSSAHDDKIDKGEFLVLNREFTQEQTNNRIVRAMDFSSFYPELVAVAYDRNVDTPLAPEGIVNVWNTNFKTPPEITFHSSSRITSMIYDCFQSNIIIGGCYSGQICIWDTRANKKNPVCRTQLSSNAHSQPIQCMKIVGSQNAHDLITVSTDGRLCSWSVDNLQAPIESISLVCKSKRQVTALSMSFFHSNINNFVIGSEENSIYLCDRHGNKDDMTRGIQAHDMPVTSVDMHHAAGSIDFSPLCLSGSMDFNVKLWNLKDSTATKPLLSLERKHKFYIVEVQWSPVHPAVFVSGSADGILNLWNLNVNTEVPIATITVSNSITKLLWSKNGQQLCVGDNVGRVFIYDVHESLYNVQIREWEEFASTLEELKQASGEELTNSESIFKT